MGFYECEKCGELLTDGEQDICDSCKEIIDFGLEDEEE